MYSSYTVLYTVWNTGCIVYMYMLYNGAGIRTVLGGDVFAECVV